MIRSHEIFLKIGLASGLVLLTWACPTPNPLITPLLPYNPPSPLQPPSPLPSWRHPPLTLEASDFAHTEYFSVVLKGFYRLLYGPSLVYSLFPVTAHITF